MMSAAENFQFELSTGVMYAAESYVDCVAAGHAPRNLIQLYGMGRLLVGDTAIRPEEAGDDLVRLPRLLLSEAYDVPAGAYELLDITEWERSDYVAYGQWLDGLTRESPQARTQLSKEMLLRAGHLGIGPSVYRILSPKRFGSTANFLAAIDVVPIWNRTFANMRPQELADYAERVLLELQEAAPEQTAHSLKLNQEIERRAQLGEGPAIWIFKRNGGGGVMRHLAMNGYADVRNMDLDDYRELGAKIMRANDGKRLTPRALDYLARALRAPGSHAVATKMPWSEFVDQTEAVYKEQEVQRRERIAQKLQVIRLERQAGTLPPYLINGGPAEQAITRYAQWLVVGELLPDLNPGHRQIIAEERNAANFVGAIRAHQSSNLTLADVEAAAKSLDVYEDIWPPDAACMKYLRVPPQLLTTNGQRSRQAQAA